MRRANDYSKDHSRACMEHNTDWVKSYVFHIRCVPTFKATSESDHSVYSIFFKI